jgi:deoxyribodipyrimidine photo-lyase
MARGLFIFRRDLRYQDNIGLWHACNECEEVICTFILNPKQIQPKLNPYFSYNAFAFMLESLIELKKDISLVVEYGDNISVLKKIITENNIDVIYFNKDYTKYSVERDKLIEKSIGIPVKMFNDIALNDPDDIKPYKVYTPYYNVAKKIYIDKSPLKPNISKIKSVRGKHVDIVAMLSKINAKTAKLRQHGGRSQAMQTLKKFNTAGYVKARDLPSSETSRLSPYIKFGVVGIRELYRAVTNTTFRKELFWRDFYIQIAYHFPNVLMDTPIPKKTATYHIGKNLKPIKVKWTYDKSLYDAFVSGKTGIPIVDAGVRQLLQTGYMHNRCRMIVASVFTKLFHLDWRLGERFFANHLTDYDPCSNNGGWQWASGTGADAQPYFRIFNPYTQAKNHDPNCMYIKRWCPELESLTPKEIFAIRSKLFDYEKERAIGIALFSRK